MPTLTQGASAMQIPTCNRHNHVMTHNPSISRGVNVFANTFVCFKCENEREQLIAAVSELTRGHKWQPEIEFANGESITTA